MKNEVIEKSDELIHNGITYPVSNVFVRISKKRTKNQQKKVDNILKLVKQ
jgi:hypothetical protein